MQDKAPRKADRMSIIIPVLLITIGTGWLLSTLGIVPGINWIWTLGLAMVGVLTLAIGGLDKVTVVVAPFFIVSSCISVLRQTGRLHLDVEVPILVILLGVLLWIARMPTIPLPAWVIQEPPAQS